MIRTAVLSTLATLVLAAAPPLAAQPAQLTIQLDRSDSIREHLGKGTVKAIRLTAGQAGAAKTVDRETSGDRVVFEDLAPGKWTIRAFVVMENVTYIVDPKRAVEVEMLPATSLERRIAIDPLIIGGRAIARGKAFDGQMNLWPSEKSEEAWGFTVPLDPQGRFLFPLPAVGKWDVRLVARDRKSSTFLPEHLFRALDTQHDTELVAPEGAIRGRIVDASGAGIVGVRVHASLERAESQRPVRDAAVSGAEGAFAFEGLPAGRWTLKAGNGDAATAPLQIDLASGASEEDLILELK